VTVVDAGELGCGASTRSGGMVIHPISGRRSGFLSGAGA
jgi:glycine/D-amino acid oxidase-like deaminating enzyme